MHTAEVAPRCSPATGTLRQLLHQAHTATGNGALHQHFRFTQASQLSVLLSGKDLSTTKFNEEFLDVSPDCPLLSSNVWLSCRTAVAQEASAPRWRLKEPIGCLGSSITYRVLHDTDEIAARLGELGYPGASVHEIAPFSVMSFTTTRVVFGSQLWLDVSGWWSSGGFVYYSVLTTTNEMVPEDIAELQATPALSKAIVALADQQPGLYRRFSRKYLGSISTAALTSRTPPSEDLVLKPYQVCASSIQAVASYAHQAGVPTTG